MPITPEQFGKEIFDSYVKTVLFGEPVTTPGDEENIVLSVMQFSGLSRDEAAAIVRRGITK